MSQPPAESLLRVTVIGDGAMATVCSNILAARAEVRVTMWGRNAERLAEIERGGENRRYLPGVKVSPTLRFAADDAAALKDADLVLCAIPAQFIRPILTRLAPHIRAGLPVVSVSKGIEIDTLCRPSEVIAGVLGGGRRPVAALSGPNIAGELARGLPATMVAAAEEEHDAFVRQLQELFTTPSLRVYRNHDLVGVELAGALKNVIAIAAGILDGMKAGYNAKAALLTRGLVEISRLGAVLGAQPETFAGLAGLGDLVTTCFSPEGRNRRFGERIGRGEKAGEALASIAGVVEGMPTCEAVVRLAKKQGIEMPIAEGLHAVLFEDRPPREQLAELMSREPKAEQEG
ncbi:MAG TPA: NAD(P)H-dependent glycerol-3-phosphate dehydrogenase [Phycisphaerae bacterium]|nr:NAD(P)H-dependent glycerol-3-phosphate dehydrogenase [Phycisphaerae bacterium]